jgi:VWFA-related protein
MHSRSGRALALVAIILGTAALRESRPLAAADATLRTVYVTVMDNKGAPVPDLTAANFKVKEGGKDREVTKAEPAKTRPHLALMVEERLAPDAQTRMGLFEFVKRLNGTAEVSLLTVGLRNTTLVPFVTDPNPLLKAINELSLNPQPTSNLTEGISDMAQIFDKDNPERPVMVVVCFSGGQAGGASANSVLTSLRQTGTKFYAVSYGPPNTNNSGDLGTMADLSGREQVLGDGSKQTGGRRIDVPTTANIPKALQQIADDLAAQYAVTYALPDGVKPDKRFNISTDRKGLTLRAPTALPDK